MGFGVVLVFWFIFFIHSQNNSNFATELLSEHFNFTLKKGWVIENTKKDKNEDLAKWST